MVNIEQPDKRVEAGDKVTGEARFIDDIRFPGTLTALVLRSPHGHARIKSIDLSKTQKLEGIKAVITGEQAKLYFINLGIGDQQPIAIDKVRHMGEPVAVVVARDKWTAARARELISVEYELLKPVLWASAAMDPDAPLVHEVQGRYKRSNGIFFQEKSNIFHHYKLRKGNVEKAFARADFIEENTFIMPHRSHVQIEPHGGIAKWSHGKKLEIYSSTQSPFLVRNCLAEMFGLKSTDITVKVEYLGGGFGGKSDVTIEPLLALTAKYLPGEWVKLILNREEAFTATVVGRGVEIRVSTAVSNSGRILGEKVRIFFASGAYGSYSRHIVNAGGFNSTGPYDIANVQTDSYGIYTNQPPVGAFRGYSHAETHWAIERQRHLIAKRLKMDPVEFRLKNILKPGSINNLGQKMEESNGNLQGCIEIVAGKLESIDLEKLRRKYPEAAFGKGIIAMMKSPVMATNSAASAIIRFNEDGSADLAASGVEMGQGTKTAMRQIAAAALKMDLSRVRIKTDIQTDISPYGWQTIGSTTTWKAGRAVIDAAEKAIDRIKENGALVLKVDKESLEYDGSRVYLRDQPKTGVDVKELVFGYIYDDGLVVGEPVQTYGTYMPEGLTFPDPDTGQGNCAAEYTFGAQGAVIRIERDTGELTVLNLIMAIDAGRVINPTLARGQIVGAMVQEMGGATTEELIYSPEGRMRNNSLTDYKIPTPEDVADTTMDVVFLETPEPIGPFGARGIAEHGTVGITAAIGNAVSDALGIEIKRLPITNEKIYQSMAENREEKC